MVEEMQVPGKKEDGITLLDKKFENLVNRLGNPDYNEICMHLKAAETVGIGSLLANSLNESLLKKYPPQVGDVLKKHYSQNAKNYFSLDDMLFDQLRHDLGGAGGLQVGYPSAEKYILKNLSSQQSELFDCMDSLGNFEPYFSVLCFANFPVQLKKQFMFVYAKKIVLPDINTLIGSKVSENIPQFKHGLFEARSAYSELVKDNPQKYAEKFKLGDVIEEFIETEQFNDKNMQKPVIVTLEKNIHNPDVYFDRGALYRMLRNLLRDAVTHSESKVLKPVIGIYENTVDGCANVQIFSEGQLDGETLENISRIPYTTQHDKEVGRPAHGYGKVGARRLLENFWNSLGKKIDVDKLMVDHWKNTKYNNVPSVRWNAPIPLVES